MTRRGNCLRCIHYDRHMCRVEGLRVRNPQFGGCSDFANPEDEKAEREAEQETTEEEE